MDLTQSRTVSIRSERRTEVVQGNGGCLGYCIPSNKRRKSVKASDVLSYAEEMYDGMYLPSRKEEKLALLVASRKFGSSLDSNSLKSSSNLKPEVGRLHKLNSTLNQTKVSFDTTTTLREFTSSSNLSSKLTNDKRLTQETEDLDQHQQSHFSSQKLQLTLLNPRHKENLRKLTPCPDYPRDNFIPPLDLSGNTDEIDELVKTEVQNIYTFDKEVLRRNLPKPETVKKLWSTSQNSHFKRAVDLQDKNKVLEQIDRKTKNLVTNGIKPSCIESSNDKENDSSVLVTSSTKPGRERRNLEQFKENRYEEGFDVYIMMKRKRFAQKNKMKTLKTVDLSDNESSGSDGQKEVVVENSSDEDSLELSFLNEYDDNFQADLYSTAIIMGEENRQEPETVVVVTGHVQGLQTRDFPRAPLGPPIRRYFDISDDEKFALKDEIKINTKPKKKRKSRNEPKGKAHMVRVGGGWMKVEHHRNHHTPLKIYEIPRDANDDKFLYIKSRFNTKRDEVPIAYKKYREEIIRG